MRSRTARREAEPPRPHRRADRRLQPPPTQRGAGRPRCARGRGGDRRRCCCSTSTTSSASTTARPRRRRRGAGRGRAAPRRLRAHQRLSRRAGAARSSACCCRASTTTRRCAGSARAARCASRPTPVDRRGRRARRHRLGRRRARDRRLLGADDAGRRRRPRALRRQAPRPEPDALYSACGSRTRGRGARGGPHRRGAGADRRACARAPRACTPSRSPTLAMRTAEQLGLRPPVVLRCRLGGWLHDVGKVAIPDAILSKPGPLDDDERRSCSHPEIGAEIIQRVAGLKEAARAVRHHHERWDGAGYPDGLAGEAIPIEARIVAAADAYSAMTSDRAYRRALERAEALAELDRLAGTHLDPLVVPALVRVLTGDRIRLDARFGRNDAGVERRADQRPRRGRVGRTYGGAQSPAWSPGRSRRWRPRAPACPPDRCRRRGSGSAGPAARSGPGCRRPGRPGSRPAAAGRRATGSSRVPRPGRRDAPAGSPSR